MIQRSRAGTDAGVEAETGDDAGSRRIEAAHVFIERAFREGPALDDIARTANFSVFHFHRTFRRRYGKTPKQFIVELQVAEVQRLALAGQTFKDASAVAGFAHQSHMTTRFKKLTGLTPGQWRRAALAERATREA